jgi:hypothetical protein
VQSEWHSGSQSLAVVAEIESRKVGILTMGEWRRRGGRVGWAMEETDDGYSSLTIQCLGEGERKLRVLQCVVRGGGALRAFL